MVLATRATPVSVIWHDLECGGYRADLELWRELADASQSPDTAVPLPAPTSSSGTAVSGDCDASAPAADA